MAPDFTAHRIRRAYLCDDTIDRVINGQHFGPKWKHAVRTAQPQLKKQGRLIRFPDGRWGRP